MEALLSRLHQEAPKRALTNTTRKVVRQGVATCVKAFRRTGRLEHRPFRLLEIFAGAMVMTLVAIGEGWDVGQPYDVIYGEDLRLDGEREELFEYLDDSND